MYCLLTTPRGPRAIPTTSGPTCCWPSPSTVAMEIQKRDSAMENGAVSAAVGKDALHRVLDNSRLMY